ncbi:type 1 glutamine amidotransferase [Actinomadura harenae]|uniref:Type 1 glutamine amidotransferase n=1 Tax=Actinomadura harenae TaxID=2483351 RepID=A0A3M2M7X3_9ACTN|nr:type 1 glutamine amidotransferase [Actinomadura harenae]RMI45914.1 type 1 glutamine amidotransferase [Actinomadura harenae]
MRALIIQHDSPAPGPVNGLQAALTERGWEHEVHVVTGAGAVLPDPLGFDLVVPLGSVWTAHDPEIAPVIEPELALLRRAHAAGVPVFGICFGGQLIATALGGRTERAAYSEHGFVEVETDDPGLVPSGPWFQFHDDRWIAPPGARTVARTGSAPQAFVLGRSMGVQFHPEINPALFDKWLADGGTAVLRAAGHDPEAIRAELATRVEGTAALMDGLLDAFFTQVATAGSPADEVADVEVVPAPAPAAVQVATA